MPSHYSSKANEKMLKEAVKDGKISQKQLEKMPEKMLIGLVKKGGNGASKKRKKKKSKK